MSLAEITKINSFTHSQQYQREISEKIKAAFKIGSPIIPNYDGKLDKIINEFDKACNGVIKCFNNA